MTNVGIRELRQNPGKAIQRVKDGETVIITERGKPVAQLAPPPGSRVEELTVAGILLPAQRPETPLPPLKKPPPGAPTFAEVLAQMRDEERY